MEQKKRVNNKDNYYYNRIVLVVEEYKTCYYCLVELGGNDLKYFRKEDLADVI